MRPSILRSAAGGPRREGLAAAALEPALSLLRTARPLALPVLAVGAVGTYRMPWAVQLLAGTALVIVAWFVIIEPERKWLDQMLAEAEREAESVGVKVAKNVAWIGVLALVSVPVWLELRSAAGAFQRIGGLGAFLIVLALVLWTAGLALRLAGHASSYLRVALAVVLGLSVVRLAMAGGVLPGDDVVDDAVPGLMAALLWTLLALTLLEEALRVAASVLPAGPRGPVLSVLLELSRRRWSAASHLPLTRTRGLEPLRSARELGLSAALAATAVLIASAVYGLVATAETGGDLNRPGHRAGDAPVAAPPASDRALAEMYAPVLALTSDERWSPHRVDGYLRRAALDGKPVPGGAPGALPPGCSGAGEPCHRLTISCPTGHLACAGSEPVPRPHGSKIHRPPDAATYVRVLRRGRPPTDGSIDPFAAWTRQTRGLAGLSTLIQYWYFYPYDEWEAPVFAGLLTQRHEADWEAVTVGLSRVRPLFVAYSEHCSGTWVDWRDVEVSTGPGLDGLTHPLVAVARGSHANYPEAERQRSPDWAACAGAPAGLTTLVSYASNIRDRTDYAWLWQQPPSGLIVVDARTPPMRYHGSWGQYDETNLANFKSIRIGGLGHGPLSPPLQTLWEHPLEKILCNYARPVGATPRGCPPGASASV